MKVTLNRNLFTKGLQRIEGVAEKKSTVPMASNILFEAFFPDTLKISATDLEISIIGTYPAEVEEAGKIILRAEKITEIIRNLPKDTVSFYSDDMNKVKVKSGKAEFTLKGMEADNFPIIPEIEDTVLIPFPGDVLRDMIEKTIISVSSDETRYNLTGIFMSKGDNSLKMVSSDGHRLSVVERDMEDSDKLIMEDGQIIPKKGFNQIKKILDSTNNACYIGFNENSFVFRFEEVTLMMRPIEGRFPDYNLVIPKDLGINIILDRKAFIEMIKRVEILALDKAKTIRLSLGSGFLMISSSSPELGEARDERSIEYEGEPISIGFNARYMLDVLQVIYSDQIRLDMKNSRSPGIISSNADRKFFGVVMPIRT